MIRRLLSIYTLPYLMLSALKYKLAIRFVGAQNLLTIITSMP